MLFKTKRQIVIMYANSKTAAEERIKETDNYLLYTVPYHP